MIVRDEGSTFLLITQPNHALLAEAIMANVRSEPALAGPRRDVVLLATREHDNGWLEVDAAPTVTDSGRPCDFIEGPAPTKHDLWPRGIARAASLDPRAGALVAEHALTVYAYRRSEAVWLPFFTAITALHDALLRRAGVDSDAALQEFAADYRVVRLGDSFSLQFCNGWTDAQDTLGYRAVLRGDTLVVSPDPFAGATIPLRVIGRRIPARVYESDDALRAAVARAPEEIVRGAARGEDPGSE